VAAVHRERRGTVVAFERHGLALLLRDLVVCRAGAMTLAELALAARSPLTHTGGGERSRTPASASGQPPR
jgi:hypothetical protein